MNNIVLDSNVIAILVSFGTLLFSIFKFYKQDKINSRDEQVKFANQQNLKNYSIYIENKHKRLIEVTDNMVTALGHVNDVASVFQQKIDYAKYSESQIVKYIENLNINDEEKHLIKKLLSSDKDAAIKKFYYWEDQIRCHEAKRLIAVFRQSLLNARLYIAEEHYLIIDRFVVDLFEVVQLVVDCNMGIYTNSKADYELAHLRTEKEKNINSSFDGIIAILRKELEGYSATKV